VVPAVRVVPEELRGERRWLRIPGPRRASGARPNLSIPARAAGGGTAPAAGASMGDASNHPAHSKGGEKMKALDTFTLLVGLGGVLLMALLVRGG